jgi:hypothetical protein
MEMQALGKDDKKFMNFFYFTYPMKWNILTHNIRGLSDPESIAKEWGFINFIKKCVVSYFYKIIN